MNDVVAHFGLKRFPFDKEIKPSDVAQTEPLTECLARLDFMKRRGGILLLTGDPGVGKTVALRRFVDRLNDNLYRPLYTPLSTLKICQAEKEGFSSPSNSVMQTPGA